MGRFWIGLGEMKIWEDLGDGCGWVWLGGDEEVVSDTRGCVECVGGEGGISWWQWCVSGQAVVGGGRGLSWPGWGVCWLGDRGLWGCKEVS